MLKEISAKGFSIMSEKKLTPKIGYPYVDRRGMAESVFPVEDSFASAGMPPASHWSVGWADLMMTMFILFLVLYVHQGEKEYSMAPEKGEVIAGDTALAESPATPAFPKITDGAPLVTAGNVRKIEQDDGLAKNPVKKITPIVSRPPANADAGDNPEIRWYRLVHDLIFQQRLYKRAAIERMPDGRLVLRLRTDWLFAPGQAALAPDKPELLRKLVDGLRAFAAPVAVIAHTDNRPLIASVFAGNWELSAARAGAFARFLSEEQGVAPDRVTAAGRAGAEPVASGQDAGSLAENRRLEIVISPQAENKTAR
jgi:flagellar motor protein MotB